LEVVVAPWATALDVQARYEQDIPENLATRLGTKLDDAQTIIESKLGDIQTAIDAERTSAKNVKLVLCDMVIRWLRNPTAMAAENVGPFGYRRDTSIRSGKLYLTAEDRQMLGLQSSASTIPMADDALRYPTRPPGEPGWWVGNRPPPGYDPDWDR
jgi:hypothetical protein